MRIIDVHTHIYPSKIAKRATQSICDFYDLHSDNTGTADELLRLGKSGGVSAYVVLPVAVRADQVQSINNFVQNQCEIHPEFTGFGTVHAEMDDIAGEVERIASLGLRGIKLHPDTQHFPIDDNRLFIMYEAARGRNMPVYMHTGDPRYDFSHPRRLLRIIRNFPGLRVIAAHLGGWSVFDTARDYLAGTDCFVDISSSMMFLSPERTVEYIRAFGPDRVMFGSDFPLWDPAAEVKRFETLPLTGEEREMIAHINAERIFGI